jgi:hypothetical protein
MSARINASDTGLGIAAEDILIGSTQVGPWVGIPCGDRIARCPNNTSALHAYDVREYIADKPDGVHQVVARVADILGRVTASEPWPIKVDSVSPEVTPSGALASMGDKDLIADSYKLVVNADDANPWGAERGSSGVKSIAVKLDGQQQTITPDRGGVACPGDGCTLRHEWTLKPFAGGGLAVGSHTIAIEVSDVAGNVTTRTISVRVPRGILSSPRSGDVSEKTFKLRAVAKAAGYSHASFQYRKAPSDPWTTITTNLTNGGAAVTGPVALAADGSTRRLVWNAAAALGGDTAVQLRAIFGTAAAGVGAPADDNAGATVDASYRPNGVGANYARQELAPGQVDLLTGSFVMNNTDVSVDAPTADLSISRTYASRLPAGQTGPFGPGSLAAGTIASAGADYVNITEQPGNPTIALVDGTTLQFAASGSGTYQAPPGAEDLTLTKSAGTYTLKDIGGDETTFTVPGNAQNDWRPTTIKTAATNSTSTIAYEVVGSTVRVTRVRAPLPSGVASCSPSPTGDLPAGCRELRIDYAATITATGTGEAQWGDYTGRLKTVTFFSGDPGMPSTGVDVSTYRYDSQGRLRSQWDPRIAPALKTTYDYNADGLLSRVTPPGEQPWSLTCRAPLASPPQRAVCARSLAPAPREPRREPSCMRCRCRAPGRRTPWTRAAWVSGRRPTSPTRRRRSSRRTACRSAMLSPRRRRRPSTTSMRAVEP